MGTKSEKETITMTREQKMQKRREAGKTYTYQPNPYKKGTKKYYDEQFERSQKNKSHRTPLAVWTGIMAKLDNQLEKEKLELSKRKKERQEKANAKKQK